MKEIKLTQNKVVLVDDEDFDWLNQFKWYTRKDKHTFYAVRNKTVTINGKRVQRPILMHREIMMTPDNMEVDHIDGYGLNNQKSNLRNCQHAQNILNNSIRKDNKSGYRGVYKTRHNTFGAAISICGKKFFLGYFPSPEEAAITYDCAARQYHGEFAKLNFPEKMAI